jgi:hypothetical protein
MKTATVKLKAGSHFATALESLWLSLVPGEKDRVTDLEHRAFTERDLTLLDPSSWTSPMILGAAMLHHNLVAIETADGCRLQITDTITGTKRSRLLPESVFHALLQVREFALGLVREDINQLITIIYAAGPFEGMPRGAWRINLNLFSNAMRERFGLAVEFNPKTQTQGT